MLTLLSKMITYFFKISKFFISNQIYPLFLWILYMNDQSN